MDVAAWHQIVIILGKMISMPVKTVFINYVDPERKHPAEGVPQPPMCLSLPEKDKRIPAHELFTLFTATIILQNAPFVR